MCLIIHKPNAESKIPANYIKNAETINPDGFGITYLDGPTPETHTTMCYNEAHDLITQERPFVAHYRYATVGNVNEHNCHPFSFGTNHWLYSNGTVADLGNKNKSDTKVVAEYLNKVPKKYWHMMLSMTDTRFTIINDKCRVKRYGKWHIKDGIYYSKDNCFFDRTVGYNTYYDSKGWAYDPYEDDYDYYDDFEDNHFIAVYGTLKHGESNNHLISGSNFVGTGHTVNKYPMLFSTDRNGYKGIPYVYNHSGIGHQIQVEVYEVDDPLMREDIDILEGHPSHYTRQQIDIQLDNDELVSAWLYFSASNYGYNTQEPMKSIY